MNKKPVETFERFLREIQKPESYKNNILELRKNNKLHPFVEWVLARTIKQRFGNKFSIQPEKYGVSNGRIDMALYHTPRTVIHFEFIATCKNGHVFRDTTSLLASQADEKLAILIDEDLESSVAENFFKAIPNGQVKSIFLREAILETHEEKFISLVDDLIGSAEFKNGSTDPERFYCSIQGREIEIFKSLHIEYHNAPIGGTLTLQLQQHESKFIAEHLTSIKITEPDGVLDVAIPYFDNSPGEPYYIAGYFPTGERWRKHVYIQKPVPPPIAFVSPETYSPLSQVSYTVKNFPPKTKLRVSIFNDKNGDGCNHGQEVITDNNGAGNGFFTVPHYIGVESIQTKEYDIVVSTEDSPFRVRAKARINILAADKNQQIWRPIAVMTNNQFISVALRGLGFQKDRIEIKYEIINLNSVPLTLARVLVFTTNKDGKFQDRYNGDFMPLTVLQPGQEPLIRDGKFIRLAMPDEVTRERSSSLGVRWEFRFGDSRNNLGQEFHLDISVPLLDAESRVLIG